MIWIEIKYRITIYKDICTYYDWLSIYYTETETDGNTISIIYIICINLETHILRWTLNVQNIQYNNWLIIDYMNEPLC